MPMMEPVTMASPDAPAAGDGKPGSAADAPPALFAGLLASVVQPQVTPAPVASVAPRAASPAAVPTPQVAGAPATPVGELPATGPAAPAAVTAEAAAPQH